MKEPFESLKYRIHNIPKSADLLKEFPDLNRHVANNGIEGLNEVIRYLIYMYDPKSDLIKEEPDLSERKRKAFEMSGLSENYKPERLTEMALYVLTKIFNERKMREWHVLHMELEENNKARIKPIDDTEPDQKKLMEAYGKKGLLRTQSFEIQKALDALDSELFGDNEDIKAKAHELLLTTPEKIAAAYY